MHSAHHAPQTKVLVQVVKRNLVCFQADFMFQLKAGNLPGRGGWRTATCAFTEQGMAMLSSVLGSPRAIAVNIEIMRTLVRVRVRVRALAATHGDLAKRLAELEDKTEAPAMNHDAFSRNTRNQLREVLDVLHEFMTPPDPPKRPIGFVTPQDKGNKKAQARRKG